MNPWLRRWTLGLLFVASGLPVAAQIDPPVIGVLRASSATQYDPAMVAVREGLEARGHTAGEGIRVEQRFADRHPERLPRLAQARAALLLFSPALFDYRLRLTTLGRDAGLAPMTQEHEFAVAGALMSLAPDRTEIAERAAYFIDRLLRGARPSELPVEEATRFKLTVNLKTAKALHPEVPQSVLVRGDEVLR